MHEAGKQLRIVAVTACLAEQPHDRAARPARSRPRGSRRTCARSTTAGSARARGGRRPRRFDSLSGAPSMNLPITRWQRPRRAQAGANRGVELEALLIEIARAPAGRRRCEPARWRAGRARTRARRAARRVSAAAWSSPVSGSDSASTMRRAMSSWSWNRSPSDDCDGVRRQQRAARRLDELRRRRGADRPHAAACPSPRGRRPPRSPAS